MDIGLKDKVMMVAASSKGLGFNIARQAALEGALISIGSRNKKNINDAVKRIRNEVPGATIYASSLDVADPGSIEMWVKNTLRELGTIDGLVVNGGGPPPGTFDEIDDSTWLSGYENTLMSAVRMIREVLPEMRRKRSGSILTVTSSAIKEPIDNLLLSNVYRSGVASLVKSLSFQEARNHIRINNLVPGFFDTERLKELDLRNSGEWRLSLDEVRKINFEKIPMGRYGDPEEFGKAAIFLLSEASSYVTGIAPFYSMFRSGQGARTLIHGSRYLEHFHFFNEFDAILGGDYIRCCTAEADEHVFSGRVTAYLEDQPTLNPRLKYYLCGNAEMVVETRDILIRKGVPFDHIISEIYF